MEQAPPASQSRRFTKASRLRRRPEFTNVFEKAVRVQSRFFTVLMTPNQEGRPRLGVVASRKFGDAVRRNRAKRVIREIFRLGPTLPGPPGVDIVVIPRRELLDAAYSSLETDLRGAFKRGASRMPSDGR